MSKEYRHFERVDDFFDLLKDKQLELCADYPKIDYEKDPNGHYEALHALTSSLEGTSAACNDLWKTLYDGIILGCEMQRILKGPGAGREFLDSTRKEIEPVTPLVNKFMAHFTTEELGLIKEKLGIV